MPLYEYKCAACGDVFEVIQKFSDEPLHQHPGCGGDVERLISAAALQFKGSGWYVTDYSRGGSSAAKDREKSKKEAKESASGDSSKNGDSKPATTPAAASAKETPAK